jgi:hypothetical protein
MDEFATEKCGESVHVHFSEIIDLPVQIWPLRIRPKYRRRSKERYKATEFPGIVEIITKEAEK